MGIRERPADRGSERGRNACNRFGQELRRSRRQHGLSQRVVAGHADLSPSQVSRIERGLAPSLSIVHACRLAAVVGLELSVRAYPSGAGVRDDAHLRLIDTAIAKVKPDGHWAREVPLPIQGDLRAWDIVLDLSNGRLALEIETFLDDVQALQRRVGLKIRDDPTIKAVLLVVAGTRHNRRVLAAYRNALAADFPLGPDSVLIAVAAELVPPANGILLI